MKDIHAILNQRTKKSEHSSKMAALAKQSNAGYLTSFSGIFSVAELSEKEKEVIRKILNDYMQGQQQSIEADFQSLLSLTSEVKAIQNQAAILHGERIKKAHDILIRYREGAFTAWLIATYGNRQTPYNLMQYYEFYEAIPKQLRPQLEVMPRQAVYTLASRVGNLEKKQEIVRQYKGETKAEILELIRQTFPLAREDKRRRLVANQLIQFLQRFYQQLQGSWEELNRQDKEQIQAYLNDLQAFIRTAR